MGDLKSLMEKAEETLSEEDVNVEALMQGRFTLTDMYKQLEAMNKMGPLKQIMSMLPLGMGGMGGVKLSDEMFQATSDKMKNYKIIMDSMTEDEMNDPKLIGGSRIKRISRGSGCSPEEVRELLKYHKTMQTALKGFRGGKFNIQKMMKKRLGM